MCKNINIIYVGRKLTLKLTDVEKIHKYSAAK